MPLEIGWQANIAELEKSLVERALRQANGNKSKAAELLGIHRRLLYEKMRAYGIEWIRCSSGADPLNYPFHDNTIRVTCCGRICLHRKKINLSTVFAGQAVGLKEVEEGTWLVSFMDYDLGYIDLRRKLCNL